MKKNKIIAKCYENIYVYNAHDIKNMANTRNEAGIKNDNDEHEDDENNAIFRSGTRFKQKTNITCSLHVLSFSACKPHWQRFGDTIE